jgi:hypothetical protein
LQISDAIWPIIANTEVLDVNQAYFGNSGGIYDQSEALVSLTDAIIEQTNAPAVRVRVPAPLSATAASLSTCAHGTL